MANEEKKVSASNTAVQETELERLKRDVYRPDMEKFYLFTQMLRRNIALKKAVISHKK